MLDELRQEHPDTTITATADITKLDEIAQTIDALRTELKDIDLAIVCSGTGDINASLDYAVERPTIDTNVMGWTYVVDILYNILEQQVVAVFLTLTSDSIASIDLRLHLPAQFKFTRGSWEREAIISNADAGNQIIHDAEHANRVYRLWERNQWMGE